VAVVEGLDARQFPVEVMKTSVGLIKQMSKMVEGGAGHNAVEEEEPVEKANLHAELPKLVDLVADINYRGWAGAIEVEVDLSRCTLEGPDGVLYYPAEKECRMKLEVYDVRGELLEVGSTAIVVRAWVKDAMEDERERDIVVNANRPNSPGVYELSFAIDEHLAEKSIRVEVSVQGKVIGGGPIEVTIVGHPFSDSTILGGNDKEAKALLGFLPLPLHQQPLRLLYRASRDGRSGSRFHSLCDGQGSTITLVCTPNKASTFGGYTSVSWDSTDTCKSDGDAFLFSLVNTQGMGPVKMEVLSQDKAAICCYRGYGPTFGKGDLHVADSADDEEDDGSYSTLGVSYGSPPDGLSRLTFLAGSNTFIPSEVEVYGLAV